MRHALARGLYASGLARLARRALARRGRFVLMIHDILDRRRPELPAGAQRGLTATELATLLAWLRREVPLLTPQAFFESDAPGVLLTVDDGKANQYDQLLPVLERFEAPAMVFVATQHVRDPKDWLADTRRKVALTGQAPSAVAASTARALFDGLSPAHVQALDAHPLVTVGAHSESHPRLTHCGDAQLKMELTASKAYLADLLGRPVDLLAYPYGDYDARVAEAAARAGYRWGFAVSPQGVGAPALEIPRLHVEYAAPYYLAAKLSGLFQRPLRGPIPPADSMLGDEG